MKTACDDRSTAICMGGDVASKQTDKTFPDMEAQQYGVKNQTGSVIGRRESGKTKQVLCFRGDDREGRRGDGKSPCRSVVEAAGFAQMIATVPERENRHSGGPVKA